MKLTLSLSLALGVLHAAFAQDAVTVAPTMSGSEASGVPSMSPSMTPVKPTLPPTISAGCYDDLDKVRDVIADNDLVFVQKDITLCPNTVYDIGFRQGAGIANGQEPIVPRSNLHIKCGEDGSSANNCILRGGDFAIFQIATFYSTDPAATNIVFQGLTLEGQVQYGVFYSKTGDVTFIDCQIRGLTSNAPVLVPYLTQRVTRRLEAQLIEDGITGWEAADIYMEHLKDVEEAVAKNDQRFLSGEFGANPYDAREGAREAQEVSELDLTFIDTKFLNNTQRAQGQPAVVEIFGGATNLVMENCEFRGNKYGDADKSPVGYGLHTQATVSVSLKNICISGNDFLGFGAVVIEDPSDLTTSDIYADDLDDVDCPFAATVIDENVECIAPDLAACAIGGTESPVAAPVEPVTTPAPTPAPVEPTPTSSASPLKLLSALMLTVVVGLL